VKRVRDLGLQLVVPAALLVAWGLWSARAENFFFPPLTDILASFRDNWLFARVGSDVVPSLERMLAGYSLAVVGGVCIGLVIGSFRPVRWAAGPPVEFLRAIPPPVLIPFAILLFGIGPQFKIFVIAAGCVWPVLLKVYRIPLLQRLVSVVLPAASPRIFTGMRTALSLALILMVISEMEASTNGIGFFILQSQRSFAIPDMWSGMLLLGLIGFAFNAGFVEVERRVLRWHRGAQSSALEAAT
jgi:ABC-type nitrate/sulfonate/bicarbonate transport system permease component